MTRNEKKTAIENMAERFMSISDLEGKSISRRTGMLMQQSRMCKSTSDASTIRGKREVSRTQNMSM